MAFPSAIAIPDAAAVARNFVEQSQDRTGSIRIDDSTSLSTPRLFVMKHNEQKDGKTGRSVDRHLLQFSTVAKDAQGVAETAIVNVTIALPRSGTVSRTELNHLVAFVRNFLGTTANVDAILRNER